MVAQPRLGLPQTSAIPGFGPGRLVRDISEADWAYYLLSGLNLGIGLYFSFLLAGLWLEDTKLAAAPFLLTLIPFYNFLGLNSIRIPF